MTAQPPNASPISSDVSQESATVGDDGSLEAWIYQEHLAHGFGDDGVWQGKKFLRDLLIGKRPSDARHIRQAVKLLWHPGHKYSFNVKFRGGRMKRGPSPSRPTQARVAQPATITSVLSDMRTPNPIIAQTLWATATLASSQLDIVPPTPEVQLMREATLLDPTTYPEDDLLAKKLGQLQNTNSLRPKEEYLSDDNISLDDSAYASDLLDGVRLDAMDALLSDDTDDDEDKFATSRIDATEIQHAPLLTANLVSDHQDVIPQYGLMGSYEKEKLFLNTNVPFSAFICGVQGSGKSHTASCILENALIASKQLGRLENPLSALILSYGQFGGDGSGFSISEAAFLASPPPKFPGHPHVSKINVMVSPSNYVKIARLYLRVPNVSVTKFKLKPRSLDIDIMLTLMNVNENNVTPLYMAAVTQLLRQMATENPSFDYFDFKARLKSCRFNRSQIDMLQMRLGLLESFLDLDDSCIEPHFKAGEVTIMDMSCPFVDANTACVLFKIALQRYLQSKVAGKMIVLDEAHKYMLPCSGAKALNETLLTTIRLQRHYGARVVISTQEPTLLTDLIALCSVTIMHRFSSPEWFAAIKRHIPMRPEEHHMVMEAIESLKTGTALVYSPNAVIGQDNTGKLVKGTGKLLKVHMRKRVTNDGGQSVLAVG